MTMLIQLIEMLIIYYQTNSSHLLNRPPGVIRGFVVHESVSLGAALHVGGDFTGEDVSHQRKSIIQRTVIQLLIQVLHEHVTGTSLTQVGVTVRP
jgi:hypothetical protein